MKVIIMMFSVLISSFLSSEEMRPVPWLVEESISFLETYLTQHPNAKVLEFGSGASTVWIAKRTSNLVSVDHSSLWNQTVKSKIFQMGLKAELILASRPYYKICEQFSNETFDLILVDGRNRKGCILYSIPLLKRGGVLMLDNSERNYYQKGTNLMKTWPQFSAIQKKPDACGFCYPGWKTSWWIKP